MKYKVTLEIVCDDVSADDIEETLMVEIPDSEDFTVTMLGVEANQ